MSALFSDPVVRERLEAIGALDVAVPPDYARLLLAVSADEPMLAEAELSSFAHRVMDARDRWREEPGGQTVLFDPLAFEWTGGT